MKVGILSRWNATCGVSLHAELIGREFISFGHKVKVFAPYTESANLWWHHIIIQDDEAFITRCYNEISPSGERGFIDKEKILDDDYDLFIVESYESLPKPQLLSLIPDLRERTGTLSIVIHESSRAGLWYSDLNMFDYVIVFDKRYIDEVLDQVVLQEKIRIIPYPCVPVSGNTKEELNHPITFFSFGRQPKDEYNDYIEALKRLRKHYDLEYIIIRAGEPIGVKEEWIREEHRVVSLEEIYDYFERIDIHLLPKGKTRNVVVSSTLYQTLGTLRPIVAPNSRYFEVLPEINGVKPVVLYKDVDDLEKKLIKLIEDKEFRFKIIEAQRIFANQNSSRRIAERFLELAGIRV